MCNRAIRRSTSSHLASKVLPELSKTKRTHPAIPEVSPFHGPLCRWECRGVGPFDKGKL